MYIFSPLNKLKINLRMFWHFWATQSAAILLPTQDQHSTPTALSKVPHTCVNSQVSVHWFYTFSSWSCDTDAANDAVTHLFPSLWTRRSRSSDWWSRSGPPALFLFPGWWPHTPEDTPAPEPPASQTPSEGWGGGSQNAAAGGEEKGRSFFFFWHICFYCAGM